MASPPSNPNTILTRSSTVFLSSLCKYGADAFQCIYAQRLLDVLDKHIHIRNEPLSTYSKRNVKSMQKTGKASRHTPCVSTGLNLLCYKSAIMIAFCLVFFNMWARKIYVNLPVPYINRISVKMYLQYCKYLLRRFNFIGKAGIRDRLYSIFHALSILSEIT